MSDSFEDILARLRQNKATRDVATALEIMCERRPIPSEDTRIHERLLALEAREDGAIHQRLLALEERPTVPALPHGIALIDLARRVAVLEPCPRSRIGTDHPWSGDHNRTCAACGVTRE